MIAFRRAVRFLPVILLASSTGVCAQDMPIRVEAIRLLERANDVSRSARIMPNHKEEGTFRAYGLDGTVRNGTFNTIYSADTVRHETVFGVYHAIIIHFPDHIAQGEYQPPPPETLELGGLIPLKLGRFDESDTIHSITAATIFGRPARCIHFETVNGRTRQSNEICVDEEQGNVARWNVGEDLVDLTDYSAFEGVLLPAHIRHYINGKLRMEVEQKFSVIDGPMDWAALTPANPTMLHKCKQYRRPIIQSAPQPSSAGAGPWYDVEVDGVIREDGHVHEAAVLANGKPELEAQAIQIVSGWIFSPSMCDGKPNPEYAHLVVHFPPQ